MYYKEIVIRISEYYGIAFALINTIIRSRFNFFDINLEIRRF